MQVPLSCGRVSFCLLCMSKADAILQLIPVLQQALPFRQQVRNSYDFFKLQNPES